MRVDIKDKEALAVISPGALSAYARAAGWTKTSVYREFSDIYTGEDLPELVIPRRQDLGDYPAVVSMLIDIFADLSNRDQLSTYYDLLTANRDVVRFRIADRASGSIALKDGQALLSGAYGLFLAAAYAAYSINSPKAIYSTRDDAGTKDFLNRVDLGQTEQGSYTVTLLTPNISPAQLLPLFDPFERVASKQLVCALYAAKESAEMAAAGEPEAFSNAVNHGVSANFCEALVKVTEPFNAVEIGISWARTRPVDNVRDVISFTSSDTPILREAARVFRACAPHSDVELTGLVRMLKRDKSEMDGRITLITYFDAKNIAVQATLSESDYDQAISAHREKAPVVLKGDLEHTRQQKWRLLNPVLIDVIQDEESNGDWE